MFFFSFVVFSPLLSLVFHSRSLFFSSFVADDDSDCISSLHIFLVFSEKRERDMLNLLSLILFR